jgi:hypothetical protein
MITAAVDILGGIGADYVTSGKCNNGLPAAFLKLHGMKDPFITYERQVRNPGSFSVRVLVHTSHTHARLRWSWLRHLGALLVPRCKPL